MPIIPRRKLSLAESAEDVHGFLRLHRLCTPATLALYIFGIYLLEYLPASRSSLSPFAPVHLRSYRFEEYTVVVLSAKTFTATLHLSTGVPGFFKKYIVGILFPYR